MALGFGFNKQKVLASAEKHVQQGKLNNAIAEYEKIIEKEPKDLTVLNTIGDLYARIGENNKAAEYFKKVGDYYAGDGFTVKAIAMYKKLTKLNPQAIPVVQKLADLYTAQGLHNDARQQYVLLVDHHIKNNDLEGAVAIFRKMLEADPENAALQAKLADLYLKLGKKEEARNLFYRTATSLYERGSKDAAEEALKRLIKLDPEFPDALLLIGKIAVEKSDGKAAIKALEKVPNLDSKPDGLHALLHSYVLTNALAEAEPLARKLATVHNDVTGIREYAAALSAAGKSQEALATYDEFASALLAGDSAEFVSGLQSLVGHVKDNADDLVKLRNIFQKAGATTNIPEINELLAHAWVQAGQLEKARDLYKELAELEPSNPVHMQNYRQVQARLGEDASARPVAANESEQAFLVEDLEESTPHVHQDYPAEVAEQINTAITESELYESYNRSQQALPLLEAALARAPKDARLNQKLATIYAHVNRFADAVRACETLRDVLSEAGQAESARQYGEMAAKYRQRAGMPPAAAPAPVPEMAVAPPPAPVEIEVTPPQPAVHEVPAFEVTAPAASSPAAQGGEAHEIDLSAEWEAAAVSTEPEAAEMPVYAAEVQEQPAAPAAAAPGTHPSVVSDLCEEIKFYLSQAMIEEARTAIQRLESVDAQYPGLPDLRAQLAAAITKPKPAAVVAPPPAPVVPEPEIIKPATAAKVITMPPPPVEPPPLPVAPPPAAPAPPPARPAFDPFAAPASAPPAFDPFATPSATPAFAAKVPAPAAAHSAPILEPIAAAAPANGDLLSDFVLDLESSLGDDFLSDTKDKGGSTARTPAAPVPSRPGKSAAAAASASTVTAPPLQVAPPPIATTTMAASSSRSSSAAGLMDSEAAHSALSDLFEDFKEEVEESNSGNEDPETHYNLGVAFKEMGLLDEAIGELQKVCQAIDRGQPFARATQAYTWLAQCFLEKGVPEAAIKWYEKALHIQTDDETRTAVHYELASAYEAAGQRQTALKHFMEVYGSNIDYRDVAERIKALRS